MKKLSVKKGDIAVLALALIAFAAVLLLRGSPNTVTAEVSINGKTVFSSDLNKITEKEEIELENGVIIGIEPGKIYFISSPCSGKDCIKFGELLSAGQTAVCVPSKTVITLKGEKKGSIPDAIS